MTKIDVIAREILPRMITSRGSDSSVLRTFDVDERYSGHLHSLSRDKRSYAISVTTQIASNTVSSMINV